MQIIISKDTKIEKHPSEWIPHPDGGEYLIAGIDRPSFQYMQSDYQQKEQMIRNSGVAVTDEFVHQSNIEYSRLIGKFLVLGWRNTPFNMDYSEESAADLMSFGKTEEDPEYGMKLALWVSKNASLIQINANKKKVEIAGKSQSSTSGTPETEA